MAYVLARTVAGIAAVVCIATPFFGGSDWLPIATGPGLGAVTMLIGLSAVARKSEEREATRVRATGVKKFFKNEAFVLRLSDGRVAWTDSQREIDRLYDAIAKERRGERLGIRDAAALAAAKWKKPTPKPVIAAPVTEIKSKVILPPRKPSDFDNLIEMECHANTVHRGDIDEDVVFEHRLKCDLCASWSPGNAAKLKVKMPKPMPSQPKFSHDIFDNPEIERDWLGKSIDHKAAVFMGDRFTPEEIRAHADACELCSSVVDEPDVLPEEFLPHEDGQLILEEPVVDLGPISIGCAMCGKGSCGCVRQHRESDPPEISPMSFPAAWDDALRRAQQSFGVPPSQFVEAEPPSWLAPFTVADVHTAKSIDMPPDCEQVRLPSGQLASRQAFNALKSIPDEVLAMPGRIFVEYEAKPQPKVAEAVDAIQSGEALQREIASALDAANLPIPQDLAEAALADAGPIHLTRPFRAFTECPRGHEGVHPFELHPDAHGVYIRSCSDEECDLTWTESSE